MDTLTSDLSPPSWWFTCKVDNSGSEALSGFHMSMRCKIYISEVVNLVVIMLVLVLVVEEEEE